MRGTRLITTFISAALAAVTLASTPALATRATESPPAEPTSRLVAASFNICKVNCSGTAPSWDVRRERVQRMIAESGADIIGLQEATNNRTSTAKTQALDVARLASIHGYATPQYPQSANECRRPRNAAGKLAGPSPCDNTALLLYNTATLNQVELPNDLPSAGIVQTSSIAPGVDPRAGSRSVAWAYLQPHGGGAPFLAISVHTDNEKDPAAEAARVAVAQNLTPWVQSFNAVHSMTGTPVVLMADLNSFDRRQPSGAQQVLRDTGWTDAFTAPTKRNIQYSTINYRKGSRDGFPTRPQAFPATKKNPLGAATRIDYIFSLGSQLRPLDYEVVMRLLPNGDFDPNYQASDHQMIRTTFELTPPASMP